MEASLKCRAKRTFGTGLSALDTLTGFSADPVPEVPPGVDLVHELSSAHFRRRLHREDLEICCSTQIEYSGSPHAERSSLNQGTRRGADTCTRRGDGGCHSVGARTHEVFI